MQKVHILYRNFYDPEGKELSIGGIQTYIIQLSKLIIDMNLCPIIYQYSTVEFINNYCGVQVHGIKMDKGDSDKKKKDKLFHYAEKNINIDQDIIIFGCETLARKTKSKKVIGIQHGISWDIRSHEKYPAYLNKMFVFLRAYRAFKIIRRISYVNHLVCVDYNFVNWYRTQVAYTENELTVIPNSTYVSEYNNYKILENTIKIIFARRFRKQRGTRLFANVVKRLLLEFENIKVTFAGSGEDEEYLKDFFKNEHKVEFIKYHANDAYNIHSQHDIAVIPTIGSEGTSFSLLEAMSSGCATIATNVGGMTNIILDNYNGYLVSPKEEEIYGKIKLLLLNPKEIERISQNAQETVRSAFNNNLWTHKWEKVIQKYIDNNL